MLNKMKCFSLFIALLIIIPFVNSAPVQELNQQPQYNCSSETTPLEINILELNERINSLQENLTYYQNLSEYYKYLYESKEVNITHGELIQIFNTLNNFQWNLNQTNENITKLGDKFSIFTFEVGISILGVTGISVGLIELTLWYFKRRKKKNASNS